eukprot:44112-Chlamydomonas_euryale.AAC.1
MARVCVVGHQRVGRQAAAHHLSPAGRACNWNGRGEGEGSVSIGRYHQRVYRALPPACLSGVTPACLSGVTTSVFIGRYQCARRQAAPYQLSPAIQDAICAGTQRRDATAE